MQIECTIHREGGSVITLGDQDYHFAPDAEGRHVATVTDAEHQKTLLAISAFVAVDKPARKARAK